MYQISKAINKKVFFKRIEGQCNPTILTVMRMWSLGGAVYLCFRVRTIRRLYIRYQQCAFSGRIFTLTVITVSSCLGDKDTDTEIHTGTLRFRHIQVDEFLQKWSFSYFPSVTIQFNYSPNSVFINGRKTFKVRNNLLNRNIFI